MKLGARSSLPQYRQASLFDFDSRPIFFRSGRASLVFLEAVFFRTAFLPADLSVLI
jgi:hypothetical protein